MSYVVGCPTKISVGSNVCFIRIFLITITYIYYVLIAVIGRGEIFVFLYSGGDVSIPNNNQIIIILFRFFYYSITRQRSNKYIYNKGVDAFNLYNRNNTRNVITV